MLLEGLPFHSVMDDLPALMDTPRNQRTIARTVGVEGFGYWGGEDVSVEFRPAEPGAGIVFVRRDLPGQPRIKACIENWVETPRRTSLRVGSAGVEMIEHIMAAFTGLRVDNCEVWVDRPEMPACDGSALPVIQAIQSAGIVGQGEPRPRRIVREIVRLGTANSWIEIRPPVARGTLLRYQLDYGLDNPIGRQTYELLLTTDAFCTELAPCRTFVLQHECEALLAQGLCKRATVRDLLVFGPDGPLDNQLRFPDECVRHKLLDMVGDMGLAGCDLIGQFIAYRSGHRHNAELVRTLLAQTELRAGWKCSA